MLLIINLVYSIWVVDWFPSLSLILYLCRPYPIERPFLPHASSTRCCVIFHIKRLYRLSLRSALLPPSHYIWLMRRWIFVLMHNCCLVVFVDTSSVMAHDSETIPCHFHLRVVVVVCFLISLITALTISLVVDLLLAILPELFLY